RAQLASKHPYGQWQRDHLITLTAAGAGEGGARTPKPAPIDPAYYLPSAAAKIVADLAAGRAHRTEVPSPRELTFFDRFRSRRSLHTTQHIDYVALTDNTVVPLWPELNIFIYDLY